MKKILFIGSPIASTLFCKRDKGHNIGHSVNLNNLIDRTKVEHIKYLGLRFDVAIDLSKYIASV